MTGGCVELRGNWVTLMSMCVGLLVGTVVGVRSKVRKSRQGRDAAVKGLKVVRKVVIVLMGMGILMAGLVGLERGYMWVYEYGRSNGWMI
jgi:hypothetical protein